MKLFYRTVGDAGPVICIVHGLFGSSDNWLTVSKTIAEQGYRVILPDQRNHGQSPHDAHFDYVAMAADLHELLTDLGALTATLVGHSMGGKTVMQYAMSYPGQFSRLVVVDIAPRFYPIHHTEILRGLAAVDLATLKTRNEADAQLSLYEPIPTVRQFLLKNLYRTAEGRFAWRLNLPVITDHIFEVGAELTGSRPVLEPALFLRGAESPYVTDADWPLIKQLFPNATLATIANAGHWVQAEQPEAFVETLVGFLGSSGQ